MRLTNIKKNAEIYLNVVKIALIEKKGVEPSFIGIREDGHLKKFEYQVRTDEDIQRIPEYLKDLAIIYETIILIIDLIVVDSDNIDKSQIESEDIENHPDASSALTCFIFIECNTLERKLKYTPDIFNFVDSGWHIKKSDQTKTFLNPYNQINSIDTQ